MCKVEVDLYLENALVKTEGDALKLNKHWGAFLIENLVKVREGSIPYSEDFQYITDRLSDVEIMKIAVNGYTKETPHGAILKFYQDLLNTDTGVQSRKAILYVLSQLNVQIKGINSFE